ncbi:hypothetical protein ACHAW6_004734 [Cyclotella cf. meneghiniana]
MRPCNNRTCNDANPLPTANGQDKNPNFYASSLPDFLTRFPYRYSLMCLNRHSACPLTRSLPLETSLQSHWRSPCVRIAWHGHRSGEHEQRGVGKIELAGVGFGGGGVVVEGRRGDHEGGMMSVGKVVVVDKNPLESKLFRRLHKMDHISKLIAYNERIGEEPFGHAQRRALSA